MKKNIVLFFVLIMALFACKKEDEGPTPPETYNFEVKVTDTDGKAIADVTLDLYKQGGTEVIATKKTDASGVASFTGLEEGKYTVKASLTPGTVVASKDITVSSSGTNKDTIVIDLSEPTYSFELVVENSTGDPVKDAIVDLYNQGGDQTLDSKTTDDAGKAVFSSLTAGTYTVKVSLTQGEVAATKDITVSESGPNKDTVVVETSSKYSYELTVVNSENEKLDGVLLVLYTQADEFVDSILTDQDGVALFDSLDAGNYAVKASLVDGEVFDTKVIEVVSGGDNKDNFLIDVQKNYSQIVIVGFLNDPRGADGKKDGDETYYNKDDNGIYQDTVYHKGPYEYIQLMATEDIDFSQTPYSVVICENRQVQPDGWATGGDFTYKFDLTSGTVTKGTFFYVGGSGMVIAGYANCGVGDAGRSTDISGANWIRVKDYASEDGDGFGNKTGGLLDNSHTNADGIAVFEGTDVTSTSVPIDAVFYGTIGTAWDEANGYGYRVPDNDHYNTVNPQTGDPQPFFGQGTNTYTLSNPGKEGSTTCDFSKLGGIITPRFWLQNRERTATILNSCPGAAQLSDIETGDGVTEFIDE